MTNKKYLQLTLGKFNISSDEIDLLLLNQGLIGTDEANAGALQIAMYEEFATLIPLANISEGGYSISWNWDGLKLWYSLLAKKLGREDLSDGVDDTVQDMSFMM